MLSISLLSNHICIVFYCFGKCVEQKSLILPLTHSPSHQYLQLVKPSLLLIPVVGSAGQSPPAEPDSMKEPPFLSMAGRILQPVVPVRTVRYLSSLEEVFCRTCNQLTTLTKSIVDICVNFFFNILI